MTGENAAAGFWLALRPDTAPKVLAYIGVTALVARVLISRRHAESRAPTSSVSPDTELGKAAAARPAGSPATGAQSPGIRWREQKEVYRPVEMRAETLLEKLRPSPPVTVKPDRCYALIRRSALQAVRTHLGADPTIEQGGLLVGTPFRDRERSSHVVVVEEAWPAEETVGTAVSLEYTSQSWKTITQRLAGLPDDRTIVGSYHSHPREGVFLSPTDLQTQSDVFSHDWQLALVVDTNTEKLGFFAGEKGRRCGAWRVIDD